ncbi:MAG: phosphatidylserine decarboxylase [Acidobacteria bacterium]|nr:phosphatidylserine decarboxylase [Acidobacteriota bacterium]
MRIDRAAWPFVGIALLPAVIAGVWSPVVAVVLLVLPVGVALFFRDPERTSPNDPALVLAPADGKVMHAGLAHREHAPVGQWQQVIIFLSPLDVHINRSPVAGTVTDVSYKPGSFATAWSHDAHNNERSEIWIDHRGVPIVFRQVVGAMARRVVCRLQKGQTVAAGDRIGLMKFGSRMDVFLPLTAQILVKPGDRTTAGESVLARLAE